MKPTIILITGHPATGKTTLAHALSTHHKLPLIWKDQIKESLVDSLGTGDAAWSRKLSGATWSLLYQQIENSIKGQLSFVVEGNFDPKYADQKWQQLFEDYSFKLCQIRCETDPVILLERYIARIQSGERHAGHVDDSQDPGFLEAIKRPYGWIKVPSQKITVDTTDVSSHIYLAVQEYVYNFIQKQA